MQRHFANDVLCFMMTSLVCVDMCELIQFWCAYLSNCSVRNAPYQNADVSFYENCCCLWPKNRKIGERRGLEIGFFAHVVYMSDGVISHSYNMKGFFLSILTRDERRGEF